MGIKESVYDLVLPDVYQEGVVTYIETIDGDIDFYKMNLDKHGCTKNKFLKLSKLISIETLKYMLKERSDEAEEHEIDAVKQTIQDMIEEYNSMLG